MCVTDIYVDRYPNGREAEFRKLSICQYGYPGRPCPNHSTLENPVRKIGYGEATTEQLLTTPLYPSTPPRSSGSSHRLSGGSARRYSISPSTSEETRHRHRSSLKPHRTHRKERIIIVDAPPTPRTPPQLFTQTFTAPSSPNPMFNPSRSRPIIVDERTIPRARAPSVGAVLGSRPIPIVRPRSHSRPARSWDTPSSSHTSFDLRAEREREARERRHRQEREAELDAEIRRAQRIREQDEAIRRRPAVPLNPRPILKPVVDQSQALQNMMGRMSLSTRPVVDGTMERRRQEREADEAEAQRQRLRERQMPQRRFSVGPGHRRHRVLYDDGVYRWE